MTTTLASAQVRPRPAQAGPELSALLDRFPPRILEPTWAATEQSRDALLARLLAPPFVVDSPSNQAGRRAGLVKVLRWLQDQPGRTWQQRWQASGADAAGNVAWRHLACQGLRGRHWVGDAPQAEFIELGRGMLALLGGDVIRPSIAWLSTPVLPSSWLPRWPVVVIRSLFAKLAALCTADPANAATKQTALRRVAAVLAARGGTVAQITVGDCLHLVQTLAGERGDTSLYFYQLLQALGVFGPGAPSTTRVFAAPGQQSVEQLVDRYDFACRPVRDLLVAYLRERQPTLDYTSLRNLSFELGKMFWKDLEAHHPGIDSLRLTPEVTVAWKQRIALKKTVVDAAGPAGSRVQAPRCDRGINSSGHRPSVLPRHRPVGDAGPARFGNRERALSHPRRGNVDA